MASARYPQYRKTKTKGVYVKHEKGCPAAFNVRKACECRPSYRGRRRDPLTNKPVWGKTTKHAAEAATWVGAGEKAAEAVAEQAQRGSTFKTLGDTWIEGVRAGRIQRRRRGKAAPYSPTTIGPYAADLTNTINPKFGDRPADEISEREWQEFFDELARDGLSYSRVANIKAVASSIYAWAKHRTRRYVDSNPLAYVDLGPNQGKRRDRVALADEAAQLLGKLKAADQVPFAIAFYAGLRRGEIHRLDWLDVEFIDGKPGAWLTVRPAPGKSGEGRRLPIAKPLRAILLAAYISQGRPSGGQVTGSAMSGKLIQRAMRAWGWTREAEGDEWIRGEDAMEPIGLHECRHTYASFLMAARYTLKEIMDYMGHADLATTDRYVKVLPQPKEPDTAQRLDAYFDGHAT